MITRTLKRRALRRLPIRLSFAGGILLTRRSDGERLLNVMGVGMASSLTESVADINEHKWLLKGLP